MSKIANKFLANIPAHSYKGNNTGSSANAADITNTQLTADLNQFTSSLQGVVSASGGGTTNFLRADGSWATPPAVAGNYTVTSQTSTYAILTTDNVVLCSGGAFTVTLPTAVGVTGKIYIIKKTDSSLANIITVATTSSQTIDGNTTIGLYTANEVFTLVSDGSNWQIEDHKCNTSWSSSVSIAISSTSSYVFTVSSANATVGSVYSNNGFLYTTSATIAAQTTLDMSGTGTPTTSGTLTKVSGTGDSTITFSSRVVTAPAFGTNTINSTVWQREGNFAHMKFTLNQTAAGTNGSGDIIVYFTNSALLADTTQLTAVTNLIGGAMSSTATSQVGCLSSTGILTVGTADYMVPTYTYLYSPNSFRIAGGVNFAGNDTFSSANLDPANTTLGMGIDIRVPISGWLP